MERADYSQCVHCGLCLAACPTYLQVGNEADSPRGRIYLMRAVAEGRLDWDDSVVGHLDLCLECRACESACPAGVPYSWLLEASRDRIEARVRRPLRHRLINGLLRDRILPYPPRLQWAFAPVRLLQRWIDPARLSRLLPGDLGRLVGLLPPLPPVSSARLPTFAPAQGTRRYRVALLTGCVGSVLFGSVNQATVQVLTRNGCDVVVPPGQGCCGALHLHTGASARAREMARKNLEAFNPADVDAIITNAAGCGSTLKDYGRLFAGDDKMEERARAFSAKVRDIAEFLAEIDLEPPTGPIRRRATYHDACHLAHGQGIRAEPRRLLAMIPGLELVPLRDSEMCCGSAGLYSLLQPDMSSRLLEQKVAAILDTGADLVATGNPGCAMQIMKGLRERNVPVEVKHPVELLAESYAAAKESSGAGAGVAAAS